MTDANLVRRIRRGEDSTMEFKRVLNCPAIGSANPLRKELADELAAFANSNGGMLVLGVDDTTREAVGIPLEHLDAVERWVCEVCNDSVDPPLYAVIRKVRLPNCPLETLVPVVRIDIDRSLLVHRSPGRIPPQIRQVRSAKCPPRNLPGSSVDRSQNCMIPFDEWLAPGTSPADLDNSLVPAAFCRRIRM